MSAVNGVDLFVIGAGSGGTRAARIAAGHGANVMIAEESRIGGTCVIRGCVPKKLFVYASRFADDLRDAAGFGWDIAPARFQWPRLRDAVEAEVTRLSGLYRQGLDNAGVRIAETRAVIEDAHTLRLDATGERIHAKTILIATGGWPSLEPAIPGIELAISSNEVFHLAKLPKSMVIIGGGYVALEFASVFARLGVEVHLVHRGEGILRGFEESLRTHLRDALLAKGIVMHLGCTIARITADGHGLRRAHLYDTRVLNEQIIEAGVVLVATGRRPNTRGLGLEAAGVALAANGAVKVDANSCSNVPSIYAVGDVTDRVNLTPVAIREGHAFADSTFGKKSWNVDHSLYASAVFTTPELGTVGMSEATAIAAGHSVKVFETAFRPMRATISGGNERVYMKLITDAATDKVLGVHMLGEAAAEIIQSIAIAVTMGATKADFDRTIALHPSAAEEFVTMRPAQG